MKKKILVVDDALVMLKMLELKLEENNYDVILASDGKEAIDKVGSDVSLVILDMILPDMKGWDVARYIREKKGLENIPIIYLTGMESIDEVKLLQTHAVSFLRKPVDPELLLAKIAAALRRSSYRKEMESAARTGIGEIALAIISTMIVLTVAFFTTIRIFGKTAITPYAEIQLQEIIPHLNKVLLGEGFIFIFILAVASISFFHSVNTRLKKVIELLNKAVIYK